MLARSAAAGAVISVGVFGGDVAVAEVAVLLHSLCFYWLE